MKGQIYDDKLKAKVEETKLVGIINDIHITAVVGTKEYYTEITDDSLISVLNMEKYSAGDFVPYTGASKHIDLNGKNIFNINTLTAEEIIANDGITLNGERITEWGSIEHTPTKIERFEITNTELNNMSITLTKEVKNPNSIRVFIENIGLMAEVGVDYSISDNVIYWTGYEFHSKLELGDKLRVFYD